MDDTRRPAFSHMHVFCITATVWAAPYKVWVRSETETGAVDYFKDRLERAKVPHTSIDSVEYVGPYVASEWEE